MTSTAGPGPLRPGWPRRSLLGGALGIGLAGAAPAPLPIPSGDAMAFRMIRRGSEIGRHSLTFERNGDSTTVRVAIDAKVSLLSVVLYRYTHRGTEIWRDGDLTSITGETDKNGQKERISARRDAEGLVVEGSQTKRYVAPPGATPTSYWNKRQLDAPMISLEDGVLLRPKIAARGREGLHTADGTLIGAEHYSLTGDFSVDVWYDDNRQWASLGLSVADGSEIRYERL